MRLSLLVVQAVLQLCSPVILSDPLLYISQLEEGHLCFLSLFTEPWLNPLLEDVVPDLDIHSPPRLTETSDLDPQFPDSLFMYGENANLKWVKWEGSLPNGAVGIYNGYTERHDYICKVNCEAGFYTASKASTPTLTRSIHPQSSKSWSTKMTANIPFTGRLSRTYHNGDTHWTTITGIYDGVRVGEINAVVERCQPVSDDIPCYPDETDY
ncbi:unnamed protein product, partial [Coregonus sp. 'balchen']